MKDQRYELKFVTPHTYLHQVRSWINQHPEGFITAYPSRRVNSIYFDTPNLDSLLGNLHGENQRRKLRLRWYGADLSHALARFELKYKNSQMGDKLFHPIEAPLDFTKTWLEILPQLRIKLPLVWRVRLGQAFRPIILNHYERDYFVSRDGAIRLTVDSEMCAYDQRLSVRPNLRSKVLLANNVVIEVKADRDSAERLHSAVNHIPVMRTRHSKYVNGTLAALS